jgi:hypothetical protein
MRKRIVKKWRHCGQFSQIAVAMLRSAGIPARTVYGFYIGAEGNAGTHVAVDRSRGVKRGVLSRFVSAASGIVISSLELRADHAGI